jgi:SAM-dependent methyltransferase/O-antigen/teichoic acid export membrane protein
MPRNGNAAVHFGGALTSKLLPPVVQFALLVIVGRRGTLADVGAVALASAAAFLCGSLAEAGFGTSLSVPRAYFGTEEPPLRATRAVRVGAAVLGSLAYVVLWALGLGAHHGDLLIAAPLPFVLALAYGQAGVMNQRQMLHQEALISFGEAVVAVVGALVMVHVIAPVGAVLVALVCARSLGACARALVLRTLQVSANSVDAVLRRQLPFVATTGAMVAQGQADILVLGFMGSLAVLGVYAPLLRLAYGALLVAEALGWALYPARREETQAPVRGIGGRMVRHWRRVGVLTGIVVAGAFAGLAEPLLHVVVGRPVHGLVYPVACLSLVIVIRFGSFVVGVDLVRAGLQSRRFVYLIVSAAILLTGAWLSHGTSLYTLGTARLAAEAFLLLGYVALLRRGARPTEMAPSGAPRQRLPAALPMAAEEFSGLRCPQCFALLEAHACDHEFDRTEFPGVIAVGAPAATFEQGVDARILDEIVPALLRLEPPASTEAFLEDFGRRVQYHWGNPIWEGRMDTLRLLPQASGVVLDLGCGLGTNTVALARGAAHVFALDRSINRAALTGVRALTEDLDNVTVIHADGSSLPLGDGSCDLVLLVGVLEWVGLGCADPRAKQLEVLQEVQRVLKPEGRLVVGIENRWGAHYFAGAPEEHTGLRFVSLLPRWAAGAYSRVVRGVPVTTPTYSTRGLRRLLGEVGLSTRFLYPLPSYSSPQWCFDESMLDLGRQFYLRHVFHYTSVMRRLGALALRFAPRRLVGCTLPTFWAVAGVDHPAAVAATVTGRQYGSSELKAIDLEGEELNRYSRRTGELISTERLVAGWNGRRWVTQPIRRRARDKRLAAVLAAVAGNMTARDVRPASIEELRLAADEARLGLARLRPGLPARAVAWCSGAIEIFVESKPDVAVEHGDYLLTNLVVAGERLVTVDRGGEALAPVGGDAFSIVFDALSIVANEDGFRPDSALAAARLVPVRVAQACGALIMQVLGDADVETVAATFVVAVLCRNASSDLQGSVAFLTAAADGRLVECVAALDRSSHLRPRRSALGDRELAW